MVEIFGHPLCVSINQMLFFYAADWACLCQIPILSFSCHLKCIRLACICIICRSNHRRRISIAKIMASHCFGCPHIRFSLIPTRPHISCPHIFITARSGHRQIMSVKIITNKIGSQSRSEDTVCMNDSASDLLQTRQPVGHGSKSVFLDSEPPQNAL